MWESRVRCEISKSLWEPVFGFHRDGISIAVFTVAPRARDRNSGMLSPYRRADRRSWRLLRLVFSFFRVRTPREPITAAPNCPSVTLTRLSPPHRRPPAFDRRGFDGGARG